MEGKSWMQSTLKEVIIKIKHNSSSTDYLITQYQHPATDFLGITHCPAIFLKTFWRMDHL
jgi:hypothetical protein